MGLLWLCSLFFFALVRPCACPCLSVGGPLLVQGPLLVWPCAWNGGFVASWCAGVLCAPPGVFYYGGAPAMRGAPGCLGLGHNVALLVLWLRGPFCPLLLGLFGAWLLGVDMTPAVALFFTLFLPIKSPPLSTNRDTGIHTISLPMVFLNLKKKMV